MSVTEHDAAVALVRDRLGGTVVAHDTFVTPIDDPHPACPYRWRTECDTCGTVLQLHPSRADATRHATIHRFTGTRRY